MFDLVLKGGRLIDPAQGVDARLDVAFANGKVAEVGPELPGGEQTRDVSGLIVVPGLIDLHTHLYWGGTSLGVDPDAYAKASGLTTLIDAGSAGPGNLKGFRRHVMERSAVRILPFLKKPMRTWWSATRCASAAMRQALPASRPWRWRSKWPSMRASR
jgi:dihydroorotase